MIRRSRWLRVVIVACACIVPTLWPSDVPWINDEPKLIATALQLNAQHRWADVGLEGTHGLRYGPLPTWIYQTYLKVSHNLVALVAIRAFLTTLAVAYGLLWLCDALQISCLLAIPILLSPYLWLYARIVWDNTFNIPLCALSFGAYARFLREERRWQLLLAVAGLLLMPMIHLMAMAFVVPIGIHAALFRRRSAWKYRYSIAALCLLLIALWVPYLQVVLHVHGGGGEPSAEGWWFPLLAGRYFSGWGLDYFFGENWQSGDGRTWVVSGAIWGTYAAFAFVWGGAVFAGRDIIQALRRGPPVDPLLVLCWMILIGQAVLDGTTGAFGHPHYYNSTWAVYAGFELIALNWLIRQRNLWPVAALPAISLGIVLVASIWGIHARGGTRGDHYGPTLGNQLMIARELEQYPLQSRVETNVPHYLRFPHGLMTLIALDSPSAPTRAPAELTLRYASSDSRDGRVVLDPKPAR